MGSDLEIHPLLLAELTVPEGHPEYRKQGDNVHVVQGFAVRDGDDTIVVDTGLGGGVPAIDRAYRPKRNPIEQALRGVGIEIGDVTAVVNSHLHFDHCGDNGRFPGVPITVQRAEYEAAHEPYYTVPEWLDAPGLDYRLVDGEARVTRRTRVVPTAGHAPGHQSLVVQADNGVSVIVCQAAYSVAEFEAAQGGATAVPPGMWRDDAYRGSLDRLHDLAPRRAFFSHDREIWLR